jgi:hypothetical protein
MSDIAPFVRAIAEDGFSFAAGGAMRALLAGHGGIADWDTFAASWDDLGLDTYMADGGRYRKRRHAVFTASPGGGIVRAPASPHYQSRDYNPLNGGIARWFDPIEDQVAASDTMRAILSLARAFAESPAPGGDWRIEAHQFRIEARTGQTGRPTPEGRHRDGVDFVLVLLVNRVNIAEGVTTVSTPSGQELGHFTLTAPLDAALLDDLRVMHGVTPVAPQDPAQPGYRDVLVVTFRREHG